MKRRVIDYRAGVQPGAEGLGMSPERALRRGVLLPAETDQAIDAMLAGIPLPHGFD
jgi:hypothetical protein